jgi:hypothetical protein
MAVACRWLLGWLATESEGARRCSNTSKTTRPSKGNIYKSSQYNLAEEEEEEEKKEFYLGLVRVYKRCSP